MTEILTIIGGLLGGVGLFLLAISMITDGLKVSAGAALEQILQNSISTPLRGIIAGLLMTAIVQSSSAVTVATIGFVNAGLLSLGHSLGVIYGANLGTTMTSWLVAAIGINIKISAFALPIIGIGMLLRLTGIHTRRGAVGWALVGFGLFFIGIDVLKSTFEGMAAAYQIQQYNSDELGGLLLFIGLGFMMTLLTQSSSAAIALVLTAASSQVIDITAAACMIIGANVGTTSTSVISVIGATPNAKRVALAHILFNLVTAIVALLLLPLLIVAVSAMGDLIEGGATPAIVLAMFHTVFNLLGVLLMWPVTKPMNRFLKKWFVTAEEIEGKPRYLDKSVASTPRLALKALSLELSHVGDIVRRSSMASLSTEAVSAKGLVSDRLALEKLVSNIEKFITGVQSGFTTREHSEALSEVLHVIQHYMIVADLAQHISEEQTWLLVVEQAELASQLAQLKSSAVALLTACNITLPGFSVDTLNYKFELFEQDYKSMKSHFLSYGARGDFRIKNMANHLEQLSNLRRLLNQFYKAVSYQHRLVMMIDGASVENEPVEATN